jgi:succinate dehydrogenase/fumarate reductase iron-sulfur protein
MITVCIRRTLRDGKTPKETFVLEIDRGSTIIELLVDIERNYDPSLVFRHSCHHGSCGTCGIRVNGRAILTCTSTIESFDSDELYLEPLGGYEVTADLAIDPTQRYLDMPENVSTKRSVDKTGEFVPAEVGEILRLENCIECGLCVSACPESDVFVGPFALAAAFLETEKTPERRTELLDYAAAPRGVAGCVQAFECSKVCPTAVYPSRKIIELRRMLDKQAENPGGNEAENEAGKP